MEHARMGRVLIGLALVGRAPMVHLCGSGIARLQSELRRNSPAHVPSPLRPDHAEYLEANFYSCAAYGMPINV